MLFIGLNIKYLREMKGLNQEQLGYEIGVSGATISNYEKQKSYPDLNILLKLKNYFNFSVDQLVYEKLNESSKPLTDQNDKISILSICKNLPDLNNECKSFELLDDSMVPYFQPNDFVLANKIQNDSIENKNFHVVVFKDQSITIKKCSRIGENLLLEPTNKISHQNINVDINKIHSIYIVKYRVTKHLVSTGNLFEIDNLKNQINLFIKLLSSQK